MEKSGRSRRRWLKGLTFGVIWSLLVWKLMVPSGPSPKKVLLTVKKSDIPAEGALVYPESQVAVIRSGEEIYALRLVCTDRGCIAEVTPRFLVCPCDGSVFDRRGEVLKGPADRPLPRLQVVDRGDSVAVMK